MAGVVEVLIKHVQSLEEKINFMKTQGLNTSVTFSRGPVVWGMLGCLQRDIFHLPTDRS